MSGPCRWRSGRVAAPVRAAAAATGSMEPVEPGDAGRALIEVVFLAVLVLIPVVYILIALLRIQAATLAVNQAARDAGRALDAAPSVADGIDRAQAMARVALHDQNVPEEELTVTFVAAGAGCDAAPVAPSLRAGDVYDICVRAVIGIPGVPTVITGSKNTVTGVYTLHVGELREGG